MYRFISYIQFLLTSTNQHGVHSPFVYNFITKGLYTKKRKNQSIAEYALTTAISYFNYKRIGILPADNYIKERLYADFDNLDFDSAPFDVLFMHEDIKSIDHIPSELYTNDSVMVVKDMYKDQKAKNSWERIKELSQVKVTIDLFYCGLVFFRKEQAKEHFKIRI